MAEQRVDALPKGYKLDRYQIDSVLGEGGFGITYLAHHSSMADLVAIKEYMPVEFAVREGDQTVLPRGGKTTSTYQWGLERFLQESQTLSRFKDHPNIVSVRDYFEANGTAYMVMQYEKGCTLGQWLDNNPEPDEEQILQIFMPILDGLREIHARQFLHRDIKLENIYIRSDGRPLLIDFGASRLAIGEHSKSLTNIITPGFSPKEQYSSTGKQGPWTDIYATAATMWRVIGGDELPLASDRAEARDNSDVDPLQPATEVGAGRYSHSFLKAVDQALLYLPKDRPQSVKEFQDLLLGNERSKSFQPNFKVVSIFIGSSLLVSTLGYWWFVEESVKPKTFLGNVVVSKSSESLSLVNVEKSKAGISKENVTAQSNNETKEVPEIKGEETELSKDESTKLAKEKETRLAEEKAAKLAREREARLAKEKAAKLAKEEKAKLAREKEAKLEKERKAKEHRKNIAKDCADNDHIHKAAARGKLDYVRDCLEAKVSPNLKEGNGWTPLHSAARKGHLNIVKLLLRNGASVNVKDVTGRTPLDQALIGGHQQIINYLKGKGGISRD